LDGNLNSWELVMAFFLYASFPNSRQRNRPPTRQANTYQITVSNLGEPLTMVAPDNQNRTYIILKNINEAFDFWYIYAQSINFVPSATPTFGVAKQLLYRPTTNTLYQKQTDGVGTDWLVVLIQDVGERVEPFQAASLESLEPIWISSNTVSPITPPNTAVIVDIDEGRG
jgi:hypothetical protein